VQGDKLASTNPHAPPAVRVEGATLAPGERLGPYEIVSVLGVGGMGVVYRAHDPRLARDVAIKVLRDEQAVAARGRLVREAQAMAKLSHPNVITVHEVASDAERVYVVMELVDGQTLRRWTGAARRGWREIVAMFVRAGRGLAAAHRAEVVHRDFKPDNVLVGRDGRVRVTDFGLAGVTGGSGRAGDTPAMLETWSGTLAGTPAYMAPEQHERKPVDARADQFAFCVALFEALYGRRPFSGDSYGELVEQVLAGKIAAPPGRVPVRIQAALRRGLQIAPADRFADMDALLALLERDPAATWRPAAMAALAALGVALGIYGLARHPAPAAPRCGSGDDRWIGIWDPTVRAAVRTAFLDSHRPSAPATFDRVARALDEYRGAWTAQYQQACAATVIRHEQSAELLDRKMLCLDARLGRVAALTALLGHARDGDALGGAMDAVAGLEGLEDCARGEALAQTAPLPDDPRRRAELVDVRRAIDQANALYAVGKVREAEPLAGAALERARAAGYAPILTQALQLVGNVALAAGDYAHAEAAFDEAIGVAASAHDDEHVAEATVSLLCVRGEYQGKRAEALALRRVAEAAVVRAGSPQWMRTDLATALARILPDEGRQGEAEAILRQTLVEESGPAGRLSRRATVLDRLARLLVDEGKLADAAARYREAIELRTRDIGADALLTLGSKADLASVLADQGDWTGSLTTYQTVAAAQERELGPDALDLARTLTNIGAVLITLGRSAEAVPLLQRALVIKERRLGAEHANVALTAWFLGDALIDAGRATEAQEAAGRAVAILRKAEGHPRLESVLASLGTAYAADRKHAAEARRAFDEALTILDGSETTAPDEALTVLEKYGSFLLAQRELPAARAVLVRGLRLDQGDTADRVEMAALLGTLGKTEVALGSKDGIAHLERALAIFERHGLAKDVSEARAALASARRSTARP
jgi:tetratricopeptide (TPR) repeat protein